MENKNIVDMSFDDVNALTGKEKSETFRIYRKYMITIINKLYKGAEKYPDFSFSKKEEELTLKEMASELYHFLESKEKKEEIEALIYQGRKK